MSDTVTGLFAEPADAERAIQALLTIGVPDRAVSVAMADRIAEQSFALDSHSKLAEGAALGAGTGGTIGAIVAGLTAVGALATGGAGVLVAGPLVAALAGVVPARRPGGRSVA